MKLVSIKLEKYRRFLTPQAINLDCPLVAVLGPNESGKSSLLKAIHRLNTRERFRDSGPSQEITRGESVPGDQSVLEAKFLLEAEDIESLSGIDHVEHIRWWLVKMLGDGRVVTQCFPEINQYQLLCRVVSSELRSLEARSSQLSDLERKILKNSLSDRINDFLDSEFNVRSEPSTTSKPALLRQISADLARSDGRGFEELGEKINLILGDKGQVDPDVKDDTLKVERTKLQKDIASRLLKRMPQFIFFEDVDRDLQSTYELGAFYADKKPTAIPEALNNLVQAAGLSLSSVFDAIKSSDIGTIATHISNANDEINEKLRAAWKQSDITIRLEIHGTRLHILAGTNVADAKTPRFDSIDERSDGFRQFVALFAFLSRSADPNRKIVLLIDEAERHLHYDAQADLVQMLSRQGLATKVVYTTHSLGCLPEDFGMGVRLIKAREDRSEITNNFWAEDEPGFSPLLFGMGAATMAYLPVRYSVLTEGASDMILLPTLVREACGAASLGYQVAPGLAEASGGRMVALELQGRRVMYLVDGDDGGREISKKLKAASVNPGAILQLQVGNNSECVIEDFVDKEAYVRAVNVELQRSGHSVRLEANELPQTMRPRAVAQWCNDKDVDAPSKVKIAYRILEAVHDGDLVDQEHRAHLQAIHRKIREHFNNLES